LRYDDVVFNPLRNHRRAALRAQRLSAEERAIVRQNVVETTRLDDADQVELEGLIRVFLAEKSFEGCGGLELTDEIKVTIAAEACLLLLHRETDFYPGVDAILVYPRAYRVSAKRNLGGVVVEGEEGRLGESSMQGLVVLAWDHVKVHGTDGHNVVLHEFAHQLDGEDGAMDGVPRLGERARYASWARVLGKEYQDLSERMHAGRASDIDEYGATNPAEFFAVVTEMFFERPQVMKERHAELYGELVAFYRQDPASPRSEHESP
jgi:Mlc titration factor MtfA (ptsG expression regulator)